MKKLFLFFILLNLFTLNSKAEIVYIDVNKILNNSDVGKFLNNYIKKIKNENSTKFKLIEEDLLKKEKSLIAQQNIIENEEFKKKLDLLTSEVKKYRSDKKKSIDKLNQIKIERTKEIFKILNPIITKYVETNEISIVIPKKNIIVGKKNLDITSQIINLLNENIKKLSF